MLIVQLDCVFVVMPEPYGDDVDDDDGEDDVSKDYQLTDESRRLVERWSNSPNDEPDPVSCFTLQVQA